MWARIIHAIKMAYGLERKWQMNMNTNGQPVDFVMAKPIYEDLFIQRSSSIIGSIGRH